MAEVFISYHEASAGALAGEIAGRLDKAGISSWCARRDMPPGADFARVIPKQIMDCKMFLILLNENVYKSKHIESELGMAFSRWNHEEDIRILPVEIGNFTRRDWIWYYLIHAQSVKFPAEPDEQRLQGLVEQIAQLLGKEPPQQKPTPAPPPVQTLPPEQPKEEPTPEPPPVKIIQSGKCGANVDFTLDENGVLTISGTGPMWIFQSLSVIPWWNEHETITHVEIQYGVTTIEVAAFSGCTRLTSVTIPHSVIRIGKSTFHDCQRLTSVTIPHSVTTIGDYAFAGCSGLTSVTIPDSVTTIGDYAFTGCSGLTSVTIPDSVTTIGKSAFYGCSGLTSVTIPDSVIHIGYSAFRNCSGLTSVTIPDSVTEIGGFAFYSCTGLTSVSVPARAKIGAFAFPITTRIEYRA